MPPLSDQQMDLLRERLDRRAAELEAEVSESGGRRPASPSREPHDPVEDAGELGEQRIRHGVEEAERERDIEELRQIAEAKARMSRGDYGDCIECGREIPLARLEVQPAAARCIACQQKYEQTHGDAVRIAPHP